MNVLLFLLSAGLVAGDGILDILLTNLPKYDFNLTINTVHPRQFFHIRHSRAHELVAHIRTNYTNLVNYTIITADRGELLNVTVTQPVPFGDLYSDEVIYLIHHNMTFSVRFNCASNFCGDVCEDLDCSGPRPRPITTTYVPTLLEKHEDIIICIAVLLLIMTMLAIIASVVLAIVTKKFIQERAFNLLATGRDRTQERVELQEVIMRNRGNGRESFFDSMDSKKPLTRHSIAV